MYISHKTGIGIPQIWLPKQGTDLSKWACIACDQYTSQPEYWQEVERTVGSAPSTLRMMLPEVYLPATEEALHRIDGCMAEYIENGILENKGEYITYVERGCSNGRTRHGWIVAVDLEKYQFDPAKQALIRASEATVVSRIPPRVNIRAGARLEMPHVMLLADDPHYSLDEITSAGSKQQIYDLELMAQGGHLRGYRLSEATARQLLDAMEALISPGGMLFAVGDGNHSLAAAKTYWEQLKAQGAPENHPARFALTEVVNIHDTALDFEPIHRVVMGTDMQQFLDRMNEFFREQGIELTNEGGDPVFSLYYDGKTLPFCTDAQIPMIVQPIQQFLDRIGAQVDYIHGADHLKTICHRDRAIGILLPGISKRGVMESVSRNGALPRKAFSMGESTDKRYYMECRIIRP